MANPKQRLGRGLGNLITSGVKKDAQHSEDTNHIAAAQSGVKKTSQPVANRKSKTVVKTASPGTASPSKTLVPPSAEDREYREVAVVRIDPNPYQPRREIEPDRIKDLAESIRSEGLLQPIVVRAKGERYELIAGERRWRAHQHLGLKQIMVRVVEVSDASSAVISLIENLQREGLNPIEESLGYASLMGDFDLTQEAVAERVGKARASVANALRLLQLDREIQGYLAKGMLSTGHAKALLGLDDAAQRSLLARRIIEAGLSVRDTERMVRKIKNDDGTLKGKRNVPEAEATVISDLEKQLASQLNTKVQLKHSPKKGQIIIEYYGNDDLQRILERTNLQ